MTDPKQIHILLSEAIRLHKCHEIHKASAIYTQIYKIDPQNFDCINLLGLANIQLGETQKGVDLISKAIAIDQTQPTAYNNRGNGYRSLKQFSKALSDFDRAIFLNPDYIEAHNNKGNTLQDIKNYEDAILSYLEALSIDNNYPECHNNLGNAFYNLASYYEAINSYQKAIELNPALADAYNNMGMSYRQLRKLDLALKCFNKALSININFADAHYNLANTLRDLGRHSEAIFAYDNAILLRNDYADALFNKANTLRDLRKFDSALACYQRILVTSPQHEYAAGIAHQTKLRICDWNNFELDSRYIAQSTIAGNSVIPPFPAIGFIDDPALLKVVATDCSNRLFPGKVDRSKVEQRQDVQKLRIAYYSSDFYIHATLHLMIEMFVSHNKDQFEIYGFSFGPEGKNSAKERLVDSFHGFYEIGGMSEQEVANLSKSLRIDIAVDLKGYTLHARPGIFAYGCAPIQVNYLGYPGTMGADYIDYIIADKTIIPEESQQYYTEKVVYLPHSYQVNDSTRKISDRVFTKAEVGLPEQGFVFCCFNNNYKILPPTFDGWMRILKAVPNSILWLFEDNPTAAQNLRKEAKARDVDPARLVFAQRLPLDEHLARHRLADLFIDTLPYNAHTTASDALWAGLPVLTCMGQSFAARVAGSLLNALDLPELITTTQEAYEAKAIELALNPEKLSAIKQKLERNRLTSPLFNGRLFAKHLEAAYTTMYERYRAGLKPDHIYIQADNDEPELQSNLSASSTTENTNTTMTTIQIDGKDYDTDTLSDEAKKQLAALQIVDNEIRHLQVQLGIANTARNVHVQLLKAALADPMAGDTIKLG